MRYHHLQYLLLTHAYKVLGVFSVVKPITQYSLTFGFLLIVPIISSAAKNNSITNRVKNIACNLLKMRLPHSYWYYFECIFKSSLPCILSGCSKDIEITNNGHKKSHRPVAIISYISEEQTRLLAPPAIAVDNDAGSYSSKISKACNREGKYNSKHN